MAQRPGSLAFDQLRPRCQDIDQLEHSIVQLQGHIFGPNISGISNTSGIVTGAVEPGTDFGESMVVVPDLCGDNQADLLVIVPGVWEAY